MFFSRFNGYLWDGGDFRFAIFNPNRQVLAICGERWHYPPVLPWFQNRFPLYLTPIAGVRDPIFRTLCKEAGADVMETEFVSAEGVLQTWHRTRETAAFSGVMLGRAAMNAPWLFAQVRSYLQSGDIPSAPPSPASLPSASSRISCGSRFQSCRPERWTPSILNTFLQGGWK